MRILIVEDEYITRNFLSSIVNWKEHDMELVGVVKDGIEALNVINKNNIDIVITDLKMPKMDGNKLIKELKNLKFQGKIVVLSNYDDFTLVKQSLKDGAFEYLLKVTINKDELLDVLNKAREELIKDNKLIRDENILQVSDESLKVNEYLESYIKGNKEIELSSKLKEQYLSNFVFIYLRICSTNTESVEKDKKVTSFISNVISTCALHINSDMLSFINIRKNEYAIFITSNKGSEDVDILVSNITKNVKQYLDTDFEKVISKKYTNIDECMLLINNEREQDEYKINSRVSYCRNEIKKIIEYINKNLNKKLTLEILANLANLNESYLSRIFKDELGMTISDYIKIKRLTKAKELLKISDMRVKDVAINVGIQDQMYFSRLFTKQFDMTPTEYKDKYN